MAARTREKLAPDLSSTQDQEAVGSTDTAKTQEAEARAAVEAIGGDFDPIGLDAWAEKAKPGDPTPVEPDLAVRWLYTSDDALAPDPAGAPRRAPYIRGGRGAGSWEIRQSHAMAVRKEANEAILEDLNGGVAAVSLRLDRAAREGHGPGSEEFAATRARDGVMVSTVEDLEEVLEEVLLDLAPIALEAGAAAPAAAGLLTALWERSEIAPDRALGSFRFDPIGARAAEGMSFGSTDEALATAGRLAAESAEAYENVRALAVDTSPYAEAGAHPSVELAVAASTGVAYLRACEEAGLDPARAAAQIEFTVAVGADQFAEIAKLRALRRIWARVLELSNVEPDLRRSPTFVRTSGRMWSAIDPWVNLLRGTTATFAAAVAGADGVTVAPFDSEIGVPGDLGRRMARNTQLVLMEESSLAKVTDPGGGSWYVESLTDELAALGWDRFREMEKAGGIAAVLQDGSLAAELAEADADRRSRIDRRERELTGVNTFPLLGDDGTEPQSPPDADTLAADEAERLAGGVDVGGGKSPTLADLRGAALAGARIDQLLERFGQPTTYEPLERRRDSTPFEELRRSSSAGEGARIYLAAVGPLARHNTVATWAKNFFESGGIVTEPSGEREGDEELAAAFADSGLRVAVVCAHPETEPDELAGTVAALRDAGAVEVYLAMRSAEDAEAAGADLGVSDGVEMIATLGAVAASAREGGPA